MSKKGVKTQRKLRGWVKVALVLVNIAIVAVILILVARGIYMNYYNKMDYQETVTRTELGRGMRRIVEGDLRDLMHAEHVYNILLIGDDSRNQDETSRSDTMILISINEQTEQIIMTSLMRDSWVYIPGYGAERLNESHHMGGASLLIDTIETNFHIRIDNYMKIDFYAFMDVVDALGGVEMTITEAEVENMNRYIPQLNKLVGNPKTQDMMTEEGTYTLNGIQTLAYVRCRYVEGYEFARTERQRKVLNVLFERFKECSVSELLEVVDVVLLNVTTDIDENKMLELITEAALEYKDYEMVSNRVPYEGTYQGWIHDLKGDTKEVLNVDMELNSLYLIRDIYGMDFTESEEEFDEVKDIQETEE